MCVEICGRIAKWPNAADCKSAPSGSVVQIHLRPPSLLLGCSQVVRQQTLTLLCTGPIPVTPATSSVSSVVEHLTFNQGVDGSSPSRGTILCPGGEMVDAKDLKSFECIIHTGSSPVPGTKEENPDSRDG